MLDNLPDDLLYIIFSKLNNYEISILFTLNHRIKKVIKSDFFFKYLLRRYHPMVFNSNDLYCHKCNIGIYRINDKNQTIIRCKH